MGFFREDKADAVLITGAQRSRQEELRARTRRYAWTMGVRTVSFVAAVVVGTQGWVPVPVTVLLVVLAVVLPYFAVTIANAGPVKEKAAPQRYERRPAEEAAPLQLEGHHLVEGDVLDGEVVGRRVERSDAA